MRYVRYYEVSSMKIHYWILSHNYFRIFSRQLIKNLEFSFKQLKMHGVIMFRKLGSKIRKSVSRIPFI